jgi:hypothetical protein
MRSLNRNRLAAALGAALAAGLLGWYWDELSPAWRGALVGIAAFLAVALIARSRANPALTGADPRLDIVERVVADETRRPWNPTTLPWLPLSGSPKPVLLVPAADYHLVEMVPLASELNRMGIPTRIAIGASPWSRTWQGLAWYDLETFELPEPEQITGQIAAVVVTKDIGTLGPWVQRSRELGMPTLGKVEGAQDFWDVDTTQEWRAYRNLDLVLCQGAFDAEALADRETAVVGSTRLERLWWAPPVEAREPMALINLNFTYGARTSDRKQWLDSAVQGCELTGTPYVISMHPAEKSRITSRRATSISASRLLPHATVLISRFSTMPFEAMARGVPFIYHNPHGELVKTFSDPMGSFDVSTSSEQLAQALTALREGPADHRRRAQPFFAHHIDVDPKRRSEQRSADVIAQWVGG